MTEIQPKQLPQNSLSLPSSNYIDYITTCLQPYYDIASIINTQISKLKLVESPKGIDNRFDNRFDNRIDNGIVNEIPLSFSQYYNYGKLFIGNASSLNYTTNLNISYVVSLFPSSIIKSLSPSITVDLFHIPDSSYTESLIEMDKICDFVGPKIHDYLCKGQNVLVHCFAGISRSSTVIIDYISRYHFRSLFPTPATRLSNQLSTMDIVKVCAYVHQYRNCIQPNVGFLQLLLYRYTTCPK